MTVHILSCLLIVVAFTEIVLYYFYRKRSRNINLGTRPGFIAHCMSILPYANTSLITPTDDRQSLKRKLDKLQFMLDDDGYIVALPTGELDAVKRSRGASWLSQQKSMLKFHMEPYEEISPFSPKSDDDDWLSVSLKSPYSTPLSPASSENTGGVSHSRKGSSGGRSVRFSSKVPSPLSRSTFDRESSITPRARGSVESTASSGESRNQRSLPVPPPGLSNPPTFINPFLQAEDTSSSSSTSSHDSGNARDIG